MLSLNGHHSKYLVRYALGAIAAMLAISWIVGLFDHATQHAPPPPARTATAAPAKPATAAHQAPAASIALPAGPIALQAQPMPAGLAQGHAEIALASATQQGAPWVDLGAAVVDSPTASYATVAPQALSAVAPSGGLVRLRWRGWIQAPTAGTYTLAASVSGGGMDSLALNVDGVADPVLSVQRNCGLWDNCPSTPTTGAGSVALAAGWHVVEVTAITDAGEHADVTIYGREPGASAPIVLAPSWPTKAGGTP